MTSEGTINHSEMQVCPNCSNVPKDPVIHCPMDPQLHPCQMYQDLAEQVSYLSNLCVQAVAEGWTVAEVMKALAVK